MYVEETLNEFLDLWPHRFDYLFAPHPDPGTKPDWKTETSHPLSDRLIIQGTYLYGVRPGPQTAYGLLDIDKGSPYHPKHDPLALNRICEALESLGLVDHISITSSDSQGLHIYLPFSGPLPSWQLAIAITALLENAGFKIRPGWLEVFPNRKPFAADGSISLFNGHRLPLQQGSYLLNDDLQPIASSQAAFVRQWHSAASRNDINAKVLKRTVRQARREIYRITGKADKFLNDLNAEIESGWTGRGQTNHILGRIAMRSYIFGHTLYADTPLSGQALIDDIVRVARALPGFKDYCGHRRDLVKKATEWAHSIEAKEKYFPYGIGKAAKAPIERTGPTWNQQQQAEARENIQQLVVAFCHQDVWPDGITPRYDLLCAAGISGSTLYNHKDLWHPVFITERQQRTAENPPVPPVLHKREAKASARGATLASSHTSLLGIVGCNRPDDKGFSDLAGQINSVETEAGRNNPPAGASELSEGEQRLLEAEGTAPPEQLVLNIQWALQVVKANQQAQAEENRQRQQQAQQRRSQDAHRAQLLAWVDSGDPILETEARRQLSRMDASAQALVGSG
ncbi:MAG: hypothetical protein DCF25_05915 [Leptolyngbya foveolarum]|uniref:Uncharacterized protein n=1 Tax=Leptolyngbya foveolarum TaxID=47253 RepID=A0A2W4UKD3_9CYAN|nr:MAG: hypothetical protein DCF25_05915 [Leptolyngbya foveolarum]